MRKLAFAILISLSATACGGKSGGAYGDFTSIIAVMDPSVWEQVSDTMYSALEPSIRTVRTEKTFMVTFQAPNGPHWDNLKHFRQMLVVGTGDEPWIKDVLAKTRKPVDGPGIYTAYDVWARGQQITLILAPKGQEADAIRAHLPEINDALDSQFREYVRNRMFLSGMDSALTDTVARMAHFNILVPEVYTWEHQDSIYTFRNDQPDPAELIRQVTVTWKSPIPTEALSFDSIMAWRTQVASTYNEPQAVDLTDAEETSPDFKGHPSQQVQAIWKNPPQLDWPAAGPFITQTVTCPQQDRLYLIDAWLYAPGKNKYEYMLQLENILNSFDCGAS